MKLSHDSCIIGLIRSNYEDSYLVTIIDLNKFINNNLELIKSFETDLPGYKHNLKRWMINDYCDKRKSTNLIRFNYCPICGKQINWNEFKV